MASDFVAERGLVAHYAHPECGSVRSVVSPIQAAGHVRGLQAAPSLGQDTDTTLSAAGFSPEQVAQLRALGAVA